ncbi:MAG: alpha/beta fold hydrolase [Cyclobacteriaceae bacterium]|nr:alpha/beta fold hydrolase [Cyclobacteriaceae bacterium]
MSDYRPPSLLFNRHLETIYPSLLRRVEFIQPERERIFTPDDDFLDIDWYRNRLDKCVIISHGLEGNTQRSYVRGMAKAFFNAGYDVLTWNYRGCGEEMNRQMRFYHSGATDDLRTVVNHAAGLYRQVYLIGFSLGGNLTLKFLGEPGVSAAVKKAVTISVPLNLHTSCLVLEQPSNWIYSRRFLKSLSLKVRAKAHLLREVLDITRLDHIKTLMEFDDHFTGPLHGFKGAVDYYTRCSAIHFINHIKVPTLVINAKNDPFLSTDCYPAATSGTVTLDYPERGGHVGFALFEKNRLYWSEKRALAFIGSTS